MSTQEGDVVKPAATVKLHTIDAMTGQHELRINKLPFTLPQCRALCHLCTEENVVCDLPASDLGEVTVVRCDVREMIDKIDQKKGG